MKRYTTTMMMFLLLAVGVSATNETIIMHDDNMTTKINVTLSPGYTIFTNLTDHSQRLLYEFNATTLTAGNFTAIPVKITRNDTFLENTTLNAHFLLRNNLNNFSFNHTIETVVVVDLAISDGSKHFIEAVNGDYAIEISTNLLPKSGDLVYEILGAPLTTLAINCTHDWLTCPANTTFNYVNKTRFNVHYELPDDTPVSETTIPINLSTGNLSLIQQITFSVFEPQLELQPYVFREECFRVDNGGNLTVTVECIEEMEEHYIKRNFQYFKRIRSLYNQSCPENIQIEKRYEYGGDVEQAVHDELQRCKLEREVSIEDYKNLSTSLRHAATDLNQCFREKKVVERKLINNETECLSTVFESATAIASNAESHRQRNNRELALERKKDRNRTITYIIIGIMIYGCFRLRRWLKDGVVIQ